MIFQAFLKLKRKIFREVFSPRSVNKNPFNCARDGAYCPITAKIRTVDTPMKLYLHDNQYITSKDYLQIAKLIEAGIRSIETYQLFLNYNVNTKNVTK